MPKPFLWMTMALALSLAPLASAKVIGPNDLLNVNGPALNLPPQLHAVANSVGLMSQGCTGTHIGRGFVITAGHCMNENAVGRFQNQPCPDVTIQWGVRGDRRGLISKCTRVFAMELNDAADWAIFQVDHAPKDFAEVDWQTALFPGHRLTVFSHPEMEPLRWSQYCKVFRPVPAPFGNRLLYHVCDTEPGSSGAALIDADTLKIVAIHDGGDEHVNYGTPLSWPYLAQTLQRVTVFMRH